jgi:branched-subunit amino acid aminotransferase/4-amino-4-deoxychorismate lyase
MADDRAHEYQDRAEEMRTCADGMKDQGARDTMMRLAENYDRMAESARAINRQSMPNIRCGRHLRRRS